jgi:hypothetical protein
MTAKVEINILSAEPCYVMTKNIIGVAAEGSEIIIFDSKTATVGLGTLSTIMGNMAYIEIDAQSISQLDPRVFEALFPGYVVNHTHDA